MKDWARFRGVKEVTESRIGDSAQKIDEKQNEHPGRVSSKLMQFRFSQGDPIMKIVRLF
jgi:hypothetical protein